MQVLAAGQDHTSQCPPRTVRGPKRRGCSTTEPLLRISVRIMHGKVCVALIVQNLARRKHQSAAARLSCQEEGCRTGVLGLCGQRQAGPLRAALCPFAPSPSYSLFLSFQRQIPTEPPSPADRAPAPRLFPQLG